MKIDDVQSMAQGQRVIRKAYPAEATAVDSNPKVWRFTISTETPDRERDVVAIDGWDLTNFLKNPVVLWAHDYSSPPVAMARSISKKDASLVSEAEFVDASVYPFAGTINALVQMGALRATSVGFRPTKYVFNEDRKGMDFQAQELLEYSIVPVPANPQCLVEARAAGVDLEPLAEWAAKTMEMLADGDTVPGARLVQLAMADGSATRRFYSLPYIGNVTLDAAGTGAPAPGAPEPVDWGTVWTSNKITLSENGVAWEFAPVTAGATQVDDKAPTPAAEEPGAEAKHGAKGDPIGVKGDPIGAKGDPMDCDEDNCPMRGVDGGDVDDCQHAGCPGQDKPKRAMKGLTPSSPAGYGLAEESTTWKSPGLSDFTQSARKQWEYLDEGEKRRIARHFAWVASMPPEKYDDMKLPHHSPSDGDVVWGGVRAAMGAILGSRGGVDIPDDDKRNVYRHLAAHYREFDKDPPEMRAYTAEELVQMFGPPETVKVGLLGEVELESIEAPVQEEIDIEAIEAPEPDALAALRAEDVSEMVRAALQETLGRSVAERIKGALAAAKGRLD